MKTSYSLIAIVGIGTLGFLIGYLQTPSSGGDANTLNKTTAFPSNAPTTAALQSNADKDTSIGSVLTMAFEPSSSAPVGLFDAVERLDLNQVREALSRAVKITGGYNVAEALAARLVRLDPTVGASAFAKAGDGAAIPGELGTIRAWARQAPDAAWMAAKASSGSGKAKIVFEEVIRTLAKRDPDEALSRLNSLEDTARRDSLRATCLRTWADSAPSAAMNWILANIAEIPIGTSGSDTIKSVIERLAGRDPKQAVLLITQLPPAQASESMSSLLSGWASVNLKEALNYAEEKGLVSANNPATRLMLFTGSLRHPNQLAEWLSTKPAGPQRDELILQILSPNLPSAVKALYSLLGDHSKPYAVGRYMTATFGGAPDKAREFAMAQPAPLRTTALRAYGREFTSSKILTEIEQSPDGELRDSLRWGYVEGLAKTKPEDAANELLKLPPGFSRREAASTLMGHWRQINLKAAEAWLKTNGKAIRATASQ